MFKFPALAAASLVCLVSARGQEARTVTFRAMCYQHMGEVTEVTLPAPGGEGSTRIPLPTSGFSPEFKAAFTGGVARFTVDATNPATGKSEPKVIAEGKLASGERQVFLLLPSPEKSLVYRIHAMNDDEKSFPMGGTRVLNLAALKIRLNLAGADLPPIPPGDTVVYPMVKKADEWGMYTARIDFDNGKGGWVPVATQSWKASDRKRDMVITMLDPKTRQPSIRLYQDIPPWREEVLPTGGQP
jgi:hypothetical protein